MFPVMQLHMNIFYPLEYNCDGILYNNIIFVKYEMIPLVSMCVKCHQSLRKNEYIYNICTLQNY